jgi:hypothetical protein
MKYSFSTGNETPPGLNVKHVAAGDNAIAVFTLDRSRVHKIQLEA